MQKITAFLEQYVEWVAVGIGGLFLLMMVFLYVLQTPISDKVGTKSVTLATVENEIYSQSASDLEGKMADPRVPSETVQPYGKMFADYMSLKGQTVPQMLALGWGSYGAPPIGKVVGPEKTVAAAAPQMITTASPLALPAPQWYGMSAGRSTVLTDPATAPRAPAVRRQTQVAAAPAPGAGPGGGGLGGGGGGFGAGPRGEMGNDRIARMQAMSDRMEAEMAARAAQMDMQGRSGAGGATPAAPAARPTGAAAAAPGAPAQPEVEGVDKVWITAAWEIATDELARAFTAANVPTALNTEFLRLETTREELLPDGTWGHATAIKPMALHSVPEMPAPGASATEERKYDAWASGNAQTLLVPGFYAKTAGDEWYVPGDPNPNEPVKQVSAPVAPVQPVGPGGAGRNMRGGGFGPGGGGGGMGGQRRGGNRRGGAGMGGSLYVPQSYAQADTERSAHVSYQVAGPDLDDGVGPGGPGGGRMGGPGGFGGGPGGFGGRGGAGGFGMMGGVANQGGAAGGWADAVPEGYTVPRGAFVPGELNQNILVWVHDDTVQPGKTYRYKMRYCIKNPFYGQTMVKDEVAKKFAVYSSESEWSDDVTAPSILRFFVASGITSNATVARFDVFRWQKGTWSKKLFMVDTGDMIGGKDGNVDFSTGYCLVDVKPDAISRQPVTISDVSGRLESRGFQDDQSQSSGFVKEIQWVDPNAVQPGVAPAGNFGPGNPGGPGRPGGRGGRMGGMMQQDY